MNHKDLNVWKKGIELVEVIYVLIKQLPKEEEYGLKSQLRRASVSVPTNIAEGAARNHQKETIQFAYIALGSLSEIEILLEICKRVYVIDIKNIEILIIENKKLLLGFIKHLKSTSPNH